MKKLWLSVALLLGIQAVMFGQDLLSNTLAGSTYNNTISAAPKANALNILERRQSGPWSTISLLNFLDDQARPPLDQLIRDSIFSFELDQVQLFKTLTDAPKNIRFSVPLTADGSRTIDLDLARMRVVAEDFKISLPTGETVIPGPTGLFYWGIIANDPHSVAVLSLFGDDLRLMIRDRASTYILGKLQDDSGQYVLYDERQLLRAELPWESHTDISATGQSAVSTTPSGCLQVFAEVEFELFRDLDLSFIKVGNYVLGLFAETTAAYRNMGLNVQLSELVVWHSPDLYGSEETNLDLTGPVLNTFISKYPNIKGDIAYLITSRRIGGGRADGIGGICRQGRNPGPYCVTGNLMTSFNGTMLPAISNNFEQVVHVMSLVLGARRSQDIGLDLARVFQNVGAATTTAIMIDNSCLSDGNCGKDEFGVLRVDGDPIANGVYQSRTSIFSAGKATNTTPPAQQVIFQAGEDVVLEEGFEAEVGFSAEVSTDFCGFENLTSLPLQDGVSGVTITLTPISPDPSVGGLTARLDAVSNQIDITFQVAVENPTCLRIVDESGEAVLVLPPLYLDEQNTFQTAVEIANWSSGKYDIVLESESGILTQIIEKS